MTIPTILHIGRIEVSEFHTKKINQLVKDTGGPVRAEIQTLLPESSKMRRYVMGCLLPLAVHMDGHDYKDSEVCERYFGYYKREFNPIAMRVGNKIELFGQSTKGSRALKTFSEKLQDYLHEQHGISYSNKAISSDEYKKFRDEIFPFQTEYEGWIDYCVKMKFI